MDSTTSFKSANEISIKELILSIYSAVGFLWRKRFILLIAGVIGAGIGLLYSFVKKNQYVAELTFVLQDGKGSTMGAYAGLATQFGIDLGGGMSNGVFTGDNIMPFLGSKLMIRNTLLAPANINGRQTTFANFYMEFYEWKDNWADHPKLKGVNFPLQSTPVQFSRLQDSVLNLMYKNIIKKQLSVVKPDKKLNIISVRFTSFNEQFSRLFTIHLVNEAISFYTATKIKQSKSNVDKLQARADSILTLLNVKTLTVASSQDFNINPIKKVATVRIEEENREKLILQTLYGEVVKNLELSKMNMAQESPIIQVIDSPILPLERKRLGKLKGIVIGGFLAGFICAVFLLLRRSLKNLMIVNT